MLTCIINRIYFIYIDNVLISCYNEINKKYIATSKGGLLMKKEDLVIALRKILNRIALVSKERNEVAEYCYNKYNVNPGHTMDVVQDRNSLYEESDEMLYYITEAVSNTRRIKLQDYFTEIEIKKYSKTKYKEETIEFPLVINCFEVEPNEQWIGVIDTNLLMDLRKANKINYNAEKQRVRRKINRGNEIIFRTVKNEKTISQIANLMKKREYIPDDITLDIPDNTESDYHYDEVNHRLIINSLEHFDITDGYHRYLAICRNKDADPAFNYPMEIRITAFSLPTAQRFIWQKDQKTKMTKSNSDSMNPERPSNEVVNRMNEKGSGFNLSGEIQRSGGRISYMALSDIIEYYWFSDKKMQGKYTNKDIALVKGEVIGLLNGFIDTEPDKYYDNIYFDTKAIYFIMYLLKGKGYSGEQTSKEFQRVLNDGSLKKIPIIKIGDKLFEHIEKLL